MKRIRIPAAFAATAAAAALAITGCQAPEKGGGGSGGSGGGGQSQQQQESTQEKRQKEWDKVMGEAEQKSEDFRAGLSADLLKGWAGDKGTPSEQDAVGHVTRVQDDPNNTIAPTADIYTDLTGDLFSGDGSTGQLIVAAYKGLAAEQGYGNGDGGGLVTVYNANGEILANGNF